MQTSGLVLDVYDDFRGDTLRQLYPRLEDIPGSIKLAHPLSGDDVQRLPDDVFALVLVNDGTKLRKYACIDEGNTRLSVEYFLKHAHKLPVNAQKVAAENLKVACAWYAIDVPEELEKVALSPGGALQLAMAVPIIKGTSGEIHRNLEANKALREAGHNVVTPEMREAVKAAEASGTALMPNQPTPSPALTTSKAVINKTGMMGRLVAASKTDKTVEPDVVHPPMKEQPTKAPQAGHLRPTVDVSNHAPPTHLVEKKASIFALPSRQKYPLDNYMQVKQASVYFDNFYRELEPAERHEYATNLVKRASTLRIPLSSVAEKYGSEDFAPDHELKVAFDARRIAVQHDTHLLDLLSDVEKVARFRMWKEASANRLVAFDAPQVVALLVEFDKLAELQYHYDRGVPDPYFSVYGLEKSAQDPDFSDVIGNEYVTEADLKRLARIGATTVKMTFGHDFQEEFLKDPIGVYKSLPRDQKKMLMRMANSTQPGAERTYTG